MGRSNISNAALGGAIAAAAVVLILLIILILVTAYCIVRKCRQSRVERGETGETFTYIEHKEPRTLSQLKSTRAQTPSRRLEDDAVHRHVYSQVKIPKTSNGESSNSGSPEISNISSQVESRMDTRNFDGYTSFIDDERELMRWFDSMTEEIFPDPDCNQNSINLQEYKTDQRSKDKRQEDTRDTKTMDRKGPRLGIRMKRADKQRKHKPHSYVPYDEPSPYPPFYSETL